MPFVFVGTKDYATGLLDANSFGFGSTGAAQSLDVASWYPTKVMVTGSVDYAISLIPSVSGFATSADVSSANATFAKSLDIASLYPLKTMMVGSVNAAIISAEAYTDSFFEVGTWTPVDNSGASLALFNVSGGYTKIGNMVFAYFRVDYPTTSDTNGAQISGLPYNTANQQYARQGNLNLIGYSGTALPAAVPDQNSNNIKIFNANAGNLLPNSSLSDAIVFGLVAYPIS